MITFSFDRILELVTKNALPAGFVLSKNNLFALLKDSTVRINQVENLLASGAFSRNDLLKIVNDYDKTSSLHYQTIKLLYFYFNPKREWKISETPVLEMHYMFTRAEHVLGLTDTFEFDVIGTKYKLKSDGEYVSISLLHMTEYLKLFGEKYPSEITAKITAAYEHSLSLVVPCHNKYKPHAASDFYERYKKNELAYISTGWTRHGVGLTFFGDYLVYTNRGSNGNPFYGSRIFRIKNKSLITTRLFNRFTTDSIPDARTFHNILETIVDLNNPVANFRCKKQRHPTCSFANSKSNVEPLFVLAKAGPFATQKELMGQWAIEYKRKKYKQFSNFMRDREIDEIVKSMFYANSIQLVYFYAALAKKFIREHHGKERGYIKDREEIKRACDFYERIPDRIRTVIDCDLDFVSLMKELHVKHQNLVYDSPYAWPQMHLIRSGYKAYKVNIEKGCIVSINDNETPKMHFSYKQAKTLIRNFG